jgi:hypothetical protein
MTEIQTGTPAWRARRDTVLPPTNNIFMRGATIHRRRCPGSDWEAANAAALALTGGRNLWIGLRTWRVAAHADPKAGNQSAGRVARRPATAGRGGRLTHSNLNEGPNRHAKVQAQLGPLPASPRQRWH